MQNCRDSNQSLAQTHSAMQLLDLNYFLLDISVFLLVIHSYHCPPILDHVFAVFFVLLFFVFFTQTFLITLSFNLLLLHMYHNHFLHKIKQKAPRNGYQAHVSIFFYYLKKRMVCHQWGHVLSWLHSSFWSQTQICIEKCIALVYQ